MRMQLPALGVARETLLPALGVARPLARFSVESLPGVLWCSPPLR